MQFRVIFCCIAAIFTSSYFQAAVNAEGRVDCRRCNNTKVKFCRKKKVKDLESLLEGNVTNLERLVADENEITLSENDIKILKNFTDLRFLDLRKNKINLSNYAPSSQILINHTKLEEIDLGGNQIKEIPKSFFSNFPKLQVVKLSGNGISKITNDLFDNNTELQALVLSKNKIKEIPPELFKGDNQVEVLLVDGNSFKDNGIDMKLLNKLPRLKGLNVRNNKDMPRLNPQIFYEKKGLRYLFTSGYADCCNVKRREKLRRQMSRNPVPKSDKLHCSFRKEEDKNAKQACAVRIRSGLHEDTFMGHVELNLGVPAKWRKLQSTYWTMEEAEAVCKETGHEKALEFISMTNYNRRKNPEINSTLFPKDGNNGYMSFKEDRKCDKKEYSIFRCGTSEVIETDNGDTNGVGVRCAVPEERMNEACGKSDGSEINCKEKKLHNLPWEDTNRTDIKKIDLSGNRIRWIHDTSLQFFVELEELDLSKNGLAWLEDNVFAINTLIKLDLKENNLRFVTSILTYDSSLDKAKWFEGLKNLLSLDVSSNQLVEWSGNLFKPLKKLTNLTMKGNKFSELHHSFFKHLDQVERLDISKNPNLRNIDWDTILKNNRYLQNLKHLETNYFTDCCFVELYLEDATCIAPADKLASCERMIKYSVLRYLMWFLVVLTIGGNIFALLMRLVEDDNNRVQNILICSLSLSDMLMGVYLAGIINQEIATRGRYYKYDYIWRTGMLCKVFGIISVLSSEVSVFTLVFIAYDRFLHIVHALEFRKIGYRTAIFLLFITWGGCLAIAVVPATVDSYFYDKQLRQGFYGTNSICMPLQLPGENRVAWEYCLAVFGALNFIAAIYLIVAYCQMFYSSYTSAKNSKNNSRLGVHTTMAKRFAAVVFTDVCCWVPIAMLLILSLARVITDQGDLLYMWFSICVIPINSAINPILYTISTPLFWQKMKETIKKALSCFSKGANKTINVSDKPELIGRKNREKMT